MVEIKSDEITGLIKEQIKKYDYSLSMEEEGVVVEAGDGIARVFGLENAISMEILEFSGGIHGLAMNLEEDNIGAILFGEVEEVEEGDKVKRTGRILETKVGPELQGRVVNPLGEPRDGEGPITSDRTGDIEKKAPGVVKRRPVIGQMTDRSSSVANEGSSPTRGSAYRRNSSVGIFVPES